MAILMKPNNYIYTPEPGRLSDEELQAKIPECTKVLGKTREEIYKSGKSESLSKKITFGSVGTLLAIGLVTGGWATKREVYAPDNIKEFYSLKNERTALQQEISRLEEMSIDFTPQTDISTNTIERISYLQEESNVAKNKALETLRERFEEAGQTQEKIYETNPDVKVYVDKTDKIRNIPSLPLACSFYLGTIIAGAFMLVNMRKNMKARFEEENLRFELKRLEESLQGREDIDSLLKSAKKYIKK